MFAGYNPSQNTLIIRSFQYFVLIADSFLIHAKKWHLLIQNQQWKHQNNKGTIMTSSGVLINLEQISNIVLSLLLLNLNNSMSTR